MFATNFAHRSMWLRYRPHSRGVVVSLKMLAHRPADISANLGLGPEGIVDVETAAALLAKAGDAPFGIFSRKAPHAQTTKPSSVADRCGQAGRTHGAHRRLEYRPLEVQTLGQCILRPHALSPTGPGSSSMLKKNDS